MKVIKERFNRFNNNYNFRIIPTFTDFHNLKMEGNYEYPEHIHNNYEVIIVEKGPYYCSLNGDDVEVDNKSFLLIKPGDKHQDHLYNDQSHFVLHFNLQVSDGLKLSNLELITSGIEPKEQVLSIGDGWYPLDFFYSMKNNYKENDPYVLYVQDSLMDIFFWNMVRSIPDKYLSQSFKRSFKVRSFSNNLLHVFSDNYNKNLTVGMIANLLNMSKRSLSYYCEDYFNDSPARLFSKYRIEKASELLEKTDLSVKEVSSTIGFDNQFHFTRIFKRFNDISPSEYRESTRGF